ncbi:MAG TPA: hypothetical protein VLU94_03200 [Candidatus Nitrosotalea sp.]|nr:hypothetical protein [Candidatus Nitrosotalea sp.]
MRIPVSNLRWNNLAAVFAVSAMTAGAASLELISVRDTSILPSAGGNADSGTPVISADGRYVLFTSSAANLTPTGTNFLSSIASPAALNVFLRDRLNASTVLVSPHNAGNPDGGDSLPLAVSIDGRFALFESRAGNLVSGDLNGASDVFVRDVPAGRTTLISATATGESGNGASRGAVMTPNGRFVAFVSAASNLVSGDTNGIPDVYVRDVEAGATVLASPGALGSGSDGSQAPEISADGRFVAFFSMATNLVPGVTTAGEIYVRDLQSGTTTWASTNARSLYFSVVGSSNVVSCNHRMSADGQFVAFEACTNTVTAYSARGVILRYSLQTGSSDIVHTNGNVPLRTFQNAHNLDMTPDGRFVAFVANENDSAGTTTSVYLWDAQSGMNTLVSGDTNNLVPTNSVCDSPVVSMDGRYVTFVSNAAGLTTNALPAGYHIYVRDLQTGTTTSVGADDLGYGSDPISGPSVSADGRFVAFDAACDAGVPNNRNSTTDVFVHDLVSGGIEMVSVHNPTLSLLTPAAWSGVSSFSTSADGRYLAFDSDADDVAPNDTNGVRDVFVRDLLLKTNILVSIDTNGVSASGPSFQPAISGNGRFVAFTSWATSLTDGDTNNFQDVYIRDLQNGTTELVSASTNGTVNGDSYLPALSDDGRFVLFRSHLGTRYESLFLRDRQIAVTYGLTSAAGANGLQDAAMTPDGRFVAFATILAGIPSLCVWDSTLAACVYSNADAATRVAISSDGLRLAYITNLSTLIIADLAAGTNWIVAPGTTNSFYAKTKLRFSGDGHFLVYAMTPVDPTTGTNTTSAVYLYDLQTGANLLVSQSFDQAGLPNGPSDSPDISADGRYVAYRAAGSDNVPDDLNGVPDVLLYDRLGPATFLASLNQSGNSTANNRSFNPLFSRDGRTLLFGSWASDLIAGDFNTGNDLFALSLAAPVIIDSDVDGMDDQWELNYFGTLSRDGTGDSDGDGVSDLREFQTGTDPTDPTSLFRVEIVYPTTSGESPVITWPLVFGKINRVESKDDLNDANWQTVSGNVVSVGNRGYITDLGSAPGQRYYRIVLTQ